MSKQRVNSKTDQELQKAILLEKENGTPDLEIGRKYGVTYRYIEQLITKSKGINISAFKQTPKIKSYYPTDFQEERTTVWSFKRRGNWATHDGQYRGNWSPFIPRNVILKYTQPGDLVLDYFCGGGTTAIESKLLGRKFIGLDINGEAIELAKKNVSFEIHSPQLSLIDHTSSMPIYEPELSTGDARNLSSLSDNSVDLICAHPPYSNIIHYTDSKEGDLSFLEIDGFLEEISKVARESYRVLKPGKQCAILIGDMRQKKHVIPLGFRLINVFLDAGFKLKELVVKRQHNCKTTGFWFANSIKFNFLLLAHEYLPIFEKPIPSEPIVKDTARSIAITLTLEKPAIKKRLHELETSTVWIFPEKDYEERLNKNVLNRYGRKDGNKILSLLHHSKLQKSPLFKANHNRLLYVKSPLLRDLVSHATVETYLNEINAIVNGELTNLNQGGHLVIETKDVRVNGFIEPLAKRIVDLIKHDKLWLKEIIVVTADDNSDASLKTDSCELKITHEFLLVYEVL